MSPELLESRDDYTSRVDIWALGWTFFEVLYGSDPWPVENVRSMVTDNLKYK
jgi:serine/threonine protein kinase